MGYDEVIALFQGRIEMLGYTVEWVDDLFIPAVTDHTAAVVIASKSNCTPFYLQHEFQHVVYKHTGRLAHFNGSDARNSNESVSNDMAIAYIVDFHDQNNWEWNYNTIMEWYGIPAYLEEKVIREMADTAGYSSFVFA